MPDPHPTLTFHQCIGIGAYGEVYLADSHRPDGSTQQVAVKVLKEGLANGAQAVERLRDEGRMLAILDHPCILLVHDLADISGRTGLITEYVEGADLSWFGHPDRLIPARAICEIMAQVANALDSAWNKPSPVTGNALNLVHRDIKPQNVRVTVGGSAKLLDFGIARTNEIHRDARTLAGDQVYTPGYVGPEVLAGDEQGPASDIYALGATLYLALAGEPLTANMNEKAQRSVMFLHKKYVVFLEDRLNKVRGPDLLRDLLRAMLSYWERDRPRAVDVQTRLVDLAEIIGGRTAVEWAQNVTFPPPENFPGASMTGQTVRHEAVAVITESIIPKRREYAQSELFPMFGSTDLRAPVSAIQPQDPWPPVEPVEPAVEPVDSYPRLYAMGLLALGISLGLVLAVIVTLWS